MPKTILTTGSTDGMGLEAARMLVSQTGSQPPPAGISTTMQVGSPHPVPMPLIGRTPPQSSAPSRQFWPRQHGRGGINAGVGMRADPEAGVRISGHLIRLGAGGKTSPCFMPPIGPGDALHLKIKGDCGQCHMQQAWLPATFQHEDFFRSERHHDTECVTCHINNDYAHYSCYGCHEHSRSTIREEPVEEGIYDYENCVECHRSGDEDEAEGIWRSNRFESGGRGTSNSVYHGERHYRRHDDD